MTPSSPVTPYQNSPETKKKQVTTMFDGIAPYYDFLNRFLSLGIDITWRKKAIQQLKGLASNRILDVATGTGDLAVEAVRQLKPQKVTGLDISKEMLKLADKKIESLKLQELITMEHGDSEKLPYSDASFEIVMSAFGVRNFEDLEKGLSEMFRVLAPGGHIMVLEFSKPSVFPLKQLFNFYFKYILPVIGRFKSKDPKAYSYLYESVQVFPDYERFSAFLINAGFSQPRFVPLTGGICTVYTAKK